MIVSTVNLFCYYPIEGADEEMLFGFRNMDHTTTESKFNTALHSLTVYKDCFRIFYDQWVDSGVIQKKFVDKVVVPELDDLPENCNVFKYDDINDAITYIQKLTGKAFNPSYKTSTYKKNDVLKELKPAILKKFKMYNDKLGLKYE